MRLRLVSALFAAAASAFVFGANVRSDVEDTVKHSFIVQPGGQLQILADRGNIEVETADADAVEIEIARKVRGNGEKAAETLRKHKIIAHRDQNTVRVEAKFEGPTKLWGDSKLDVRYTVRAPRKFDVQLKTGGGRIFVRNLEGSLEAKTSGGALDFENIVGPIDGHTSGGGVRVRKAKGKIQVKSSGGGIEVEEATGDVTATTSGGTVRALRVHGKAVLKTSGGNIQAQEVHGSVDARTSGGNVTVDLIEQPSGDCVLQTSGGNVTLALNPAIRAHIRASTSGGRVSSGLPLQGDEPNRVNKSVLEGDLNGGGPTLSAQTSAGNVTLKKR